MTNFLAATGVVAETMIWIELDMAAYIENVMMLAIAATNVTVTMASKQL